MGCKRLSSVNKGIVFILFFVSQIVLAAPPGGDWPDLSKLIEKAPKGGGEKDAAVIVGIGDYVELSDIRGAADNAREWEEYFQEIRQIPKERIYLLTNSDAKVSAIRDRIKTATGLVKPGGTLWFIYIGHGSPGDPTDPKASGMIVGANAEYNATIIRNGSLSQTELFELLSKGKQAKTVVLLDTCFSGKKPDGKPLIEGTQPAESTPPPKRALKKRVSPKKQNDFLILTATESNQYAGVLPGGKRPAFSYLMLGSLLGWASNGDGIVTAKEAVEYSKAVLGQARDRTQTPQVAYGKVDFVLGNGEEPKPSPSFEPIIELEIVSEPEGATVYLGKEEKALTPVILDVTKGKPVTVRLELAGYMSMEKTVTPEREGLPEFFELKEEQIQLDITSTPEGAKVYLNNQDKYVNKERAVTPVKLDVTKGKPVTVRVALPGYKPQEQDLNPSQDTPVDFTLMLEPVDTGFTQDEIRKKTFSTTALGAASLGAGVSSIVISRGLCNNNGQGTGIAPRVLFPSLAGVSGVAGGSVWYLWRKEDAGYRTATLGALGTSLGLGSISLLASNCGPDSIFEDGFVRVGVGLGVAAVVDFALLLLLSRNSNSASRSAPVSVSFLPIQQGGIVQIGVLDW